MAVKKISSGEDIKKVLQNFTNEQKQLVEEIVTIIEEQEGSLDQWVDYLALPDAPYPDWLKYWAIRNVLGMSEYDKEKKAFGKRTKDTTKRFPELDQQALSIVLDAIEKKNKKEGVDLSHLSEHDRSDLEKLLEGENFSKLYARVLEISSPVTLELLKTTDGEWKKFPQNSNHKILVATIERWRTGWCTAGESVAQSQLSRGDFFVYYSMNEQNKPTIPRAAIRMEGNNIAEVRGIAPNQNLDSYIGEVVQKKMREFPDGQAYEKKAGDMKLLTAIENKVKANKALSKDELIFLYEIDNPIEGFGYQTDPRIKELRDQRDLKSDAPVVFECEPNQIAWDYVEVNENTKAYIGPLFPGIFTELGQLEHIYTSFPEVKIRREIIEIGGKDAKQLEKELIKSGFKISDYAKLMLHSKEFKTQKSKESRCSCKEDRQESGKERKIQSLALSNLKNRLQYLRVESVFL